MLTLTRGKVEIQKCNIDWLTEWQALRRSQMCNHVASQKRAFWADEHLRELEREPDWAGKSQRVMLISIQFSQVLGILLHCSHRSERPTGKSVRTGLRTARLTAWLAFDQYQLQWYFFWSLLRWSQVNILWLGRNNHNEWKIILEYILGSSHPKEIEGLSLSPRDSSGYRWCSPRCDVSRHPQCCYNPVCRSKKPLGCVWHLYAGANPDMHDDILF